jgi:hypothetical protein
VHFTIQGKITPLIDTSSTPARLKFTVESQGEGVGARSGVKYSFNSVQQTTAGIRDARAAAADPNFTYDEVVAVSAPIHAHDGARGVAADGRNADNALIRFKVKISFVDGTAVAWFNNDQEGIRLSCM